MASHTGRSWTCKTAVESVERPTRAGDIMGGFPMQGVGTVVANGATLAYLERGQGRGVVFVHGGYSDLRTWLPRRKAGVRERVRPPPAVATDDVAARAPRAERRHQLRDVSSRAGGQPRPTDSLDPSPARSGRFLGADPRSRGSSA